MSIYKLTFEWDPLPVGGHDAVALQHVRGGAPYNRPVAGYILSISCICIYVCYMYVCTRQGTTYVAMYVERNC